MTLGTNERPLRVAIVGAGPSGFYAADALFRSDLTIKVDFFDRLPTPFGLLRGGVAPDHQQMKTVGKYYERVVAKNADNISFFGNVQVGKDITIDELKAHYDAIVLSYGAETDKKLGIEGEDLERSYTATAFVGWYNGHPDYRDLDFDLQQEKVAIIGQGNVAIDVTRILTKTVKELSDSDIAQHALDKLASSGIKEVHLIGRRGPVQSAFTKLEIQELGELEDCDIVVKKEDIALSPADEEELNLPENTKARKNYDVLKELSEKPLEGKSKKIIVRFFESPTKINGTTAVESLSLETNQLTGEPGKQKAVGTGKITDLDCTMIFRSVGYRGLPLPGVPFNTSWGVVPNDKGRVVDENGTPVRPLYTAGWIKRGPSGVLGTNKPDSTETIQSLFEDIDALTPCATPSTDSVTQLLESRNVRYVTYADWQKIDEKEVENGQKVGKPREKFTRTDDILAFLDSVKSRA